MKRRQEMKLPRLKTCVLALSVCMCIFLAFNSALVFYSSSRNSNTNTVAGDCVFAPGTVGEVVIARTMGGTDRAQEGENVCKCPTGSKHEHEAMLPPGFSPNSFMAGWSHKVGGQRFRECSEFDDVEPCFDFSRCSLSYPFLVYTHSAHLQDGLSIKDSHLLENLVGLQHKRSLTSDPSEACIFLTIIGPLMNNITTIEVETKLHSLPYWNQGRNHLLIDVSNTALIHGVNTENAIIASTLSPRHSEGSEFSILTPPLFHNSEKYLGGIFTVPRPTLLYFEGYCVEDETVSDLVDLYCALQNTGLHNVVMKTHCGYNCCCNVVVDGTKCGEWTLCGEEHIQLELCSNATFCLILGENGETRGFTTSTRLVEALKSGSVPIVVGMSVFPFGDVIEWQRAAVILPYGELLSVVNVITETGFDAILEYRKQGRFLFDTYFSSPEKVIDSVFAIVRYRALHPPPLVPDIHTPSVSLKEKPPNSTQLHKSSVWFPYSSDFWNKPPGPFHHFPSTPFRPTPIHYSGAKKEIRRDITIRHILCLKQLNQSVYWKLTSKDIACLELLRKIPFLREIELDLLDRFRSLLQNFDAALLRRVHSPLFRTRWQQLVQHLYRKFTRHKSNGITGSEFSSNLYGNYADENFTLLMHTTECNRDFVESLSSYKGLPFLQKVVVLCRHTGDTHDGEEVGMPVDVVRIEDPSRSQFLPLSKIQTEAVLYISGHVNISHDDIQFAFRVWREHRDSIVGWGGGYHAAWSDSAHRWLIGMGDSCEVSMVNNGAAFLHKYYFYLYSYWMPREAMDLVEKHPSCSDMAMSFLVSHISRKPPLKLLKRNCLMVVHSSPSKSIKYCLSQEPDFLTTRSRKRFVSLIIMGMYNADTNAYFFQSSTFPGELGKERTCYLAWFPGLLTVQFVIGLQYAATAE